MLLRLQSLLAAFLLLSAAALLAAESAIPLRFGSVAMDTPAVMHQRLKPLTEYLSAELQRPVTLKLSPNMSAAIEEVASGNVDVAYLTPVAYLKAHEQGAARLVVKMVTKDVPKFRLVIAVNSASPIREVAQLAGKRFAFGDRAALLQRAVVVAAGMPLEQLGSYEFLGHYNNIVRGVLHQYFDAGVLTETEALKWQGKGITIIHSSEELPPYNISASKHVDDELMNQLKAAFIKLDDNNPGHRQVIQALEKDYSGFATTSDSEYAVIRRLIKPFDGK
jgi:phosphonate transport system substrate-binding protein